MSTRQVGKCLSGSAGSVVSHNLSPRETELLYTRERIALLTCLHKIHSCFTSHKTPSCFTQVHLSGTACQHLERIHSVTQGGERQPWPSRSNTRVAFEAHLDIRSGTFQRPLHEHSGRIMSGIARGSARGLVSQNVSNDMVLEIQPSPPTQNR